MAWSTRTTVRTGPLLPGPRDSSCRKGGTINPKEAGTLGLSWALCPSQQISLRHCGVFWSDLGLAAFHRCTLRSQAQEHLLY
jgi:hypothetical protein